MRFSEVALLRSICRDSFYRFVVEFWDTIIQEKPVFNWHIKYICDELQRVAERVMRGEPRLYDLIINVPPGSTKSTIISQMFPAWVWTKMPSAKFINASYSERIALKDSIRCRDVVRSEKYQRIFPEVKLRDDVDTKGLFENTLTGYRYCAGVGGGVTGYHGHFLTIDDPINPEEAFSEAELTVANRWMEQTLPPRRIEKAVSVVILVQQRLHQADPTGEILEKSGGRGVKHICLPGTSEFPVKPADLAQFYTNGLLDPVRLPQQALDKMREDMGEYGYAAQIGQQPVPLGGGQFQVDRLVKIRSLDEAPGRIERVVRSWDKAGTKGGGAYSVGTKMGITVKGFFVIMDVVRGQWNSAKREEMILATADLDGYDTEVIVEVEAGSGGKESGESTVRNLAGYRVHTYHPTGDKEARAYAFSCQVGAGNVYILDDQPWTRPYIEELRFFPFSKYKDQVDSSSGAFARLHRKVVKVGGIRGLLNTR